MAYSEDLRERVIGFVLAGGSKTEGAERFGLKKLGFTRKRLCVFMRKAHSVSVPRALLRK